MFASPVAARMTFEQFLQWSDEDTHAEWVDGEVAPMSPIGLEHQYISGFLLEIIRLYERIKRLGEVLQVE